jgi:hypothetical protein
MKLLGGDYTYTRPSASLGWTFPWCRDGFFRIAGGITGRYQDSQWIDNSASISTRVSTPTYRWLRVVAQSTLETRWHDTQNQDYFIGSDSGLRGYNINQFFGDRRFSGQIEARSIPFPLWVLRAGGVVFYEAGGAANTLNDMSVYHDVGFGARVLLVQTSRELFRFDLAFPLLGVPGNPAGSPHFIAGFDSYF